MYKPIDSVTCCKCHKEKHPCHLIALTGGPGAGKTALLEIARRNFCQHIQELPEAASIVFGGGFWRKSSSSAKRAAQRAIFHVQRELERIVEEEGEIAVGLCDRGTVDGLAYWPGDPSEFWSAVGSTREAELARYAAVIHLHPPHDPRAYNHNNPLRVESAVEAHEIDERIKKAWEGHPKRFFVNSTDDFMHKVRHAIGIIESEIPPCCRIAIQ